MRLIRRLLLGLCLLPGVAQAGPAFEEDRDFLNKSHLYCEGETAENLPFFAIVDMENEKDVASMEEMGISCRIFKGSNLTFLGSLAIDVKGNTPTYKVTIYEFCDDNHVSWYHWEYENIRY